MEEKEADINTLAYQEMLNESQESLQGHTELSIPTNEENEKTVVIEKSTPPIEIILCALAMFALTHKTPYGGIGALLAQGFFLYTLYIWSKKHSRPLSTDSWISGIFALLFAFSDVITTSSIAQQFNFFGFWTSNILFLCLGFGMPFIQKHPIPLFRSLFTTLYRGLSFTPLKKYLYFPHQDTIRPYTKGFSIAAPILCVFFALFSQADAQFSQTAASILSSLTGESATDIVYGFGCLIFILIAVLTITENLFGKSLVFKNTPIHSPSIQQETNVVLTLVNALFGMFLFSQTSYLFGGEAYRYEQDLNYSDYAVAGFYELMTAVGLVIFMSLSLRFFHQEKCSTFQKSLYGILLAQSMIILISAFNRMNLYIDVYGYTQARIFGIVFILTAGVGLLLSMKNIITETTQDHLLKNLLFTGALGGLVFGFIQPDTHSAKWNIQADTKMSTAEFIRQHNDKDPGAILALLDKDPQAKNLFRRSKYCTADFRSFQLTRHLLCQKLK
ncbi:MAG: hypothetical protein CL916_01310 [Deltaproteobacteria bacterium]|nr:hypothetical protein [Deltaproteobacteria bacterium]